MADEKIFATLILKQVKAALRKTPNQEDCLNILKIYNPDLEINDLRLKTQRSKLFKELNLRVHPDKHCEKLRKEATEIFQELQDFIKDCENLDFSDKLMSARKKLKRPTTVTPSKDYPPYFRAEKKWNSISKFNDCYSTSLSLCFNMRGQIWHFAHTCRYIGRVLNPDWSNFEPLFYPDKGLIDIEAIKDEIQNQGPVISRSYVSPKGKQNDDDCPIIMGWETNDVQGEVWIIRFPSLGNKDFQIAFETCQIEDVIVCPKMQSIKSFKWQSGPYFHCSGKEQWKNFKNGLEARRSIEDFSSFWSELPIKSFSALVKNPIQCEIYEEGDYTDSKRAMFYDVTFNSESDIKLHFNWV